MQRVGKEGWIRVWVFSASEAIAEGGKFVIELDFIGGGTLRAERLREG